MTQPRTGPPHGLGTPTRRSTSRGARGVPPRRRPHRPHAYRRRGPAWALLAASVAMLVMGMILPQGLLFASGLVTVGTATYLLAPPPDRDRHGLP
ncbi:hypothetical protein ACIBK8_16460 [Streptomyces sp. NPDC050161]|uniref:hypothetical protein n=1 Tax=Streptomyces sp. NPDC050161 TaxID=3365604 RepID=UPI0037AAAA98